MSVAVEQEQRQHWEREDRKSTVITFALAAQTAALVAVIGGGFYWAGDTSRRIAVLEANDADTKRQSERMAVVETQIKALYESQIRSETLLRTYVDRDSGSKSR